MSRAADTGARAVVLLSGGLDSSTALAWARAQGFDCYALTVAYGQRHAKILFDQQNGGLLVFEAQ